MSVSFQEKIMQSTRRHSYDLNFKLKIVEEAEAVKNWIGKLHASMEFPCQWYANGDTNSMCCLTGEPWLSNVHPWFGTDQKIQI